MQGTNDTAPETGRDNSDIIESNEPFKPDDPWCEAFEAQLTAKLIDGLRNYARPRAFAVGSAGRKVDDYYTRELVQDAIGDTWTGRLRWDPSRCALEHHLLRAIQSRTDKHRKHAEANPHDSLGDETFASRAAEAGASELCSTPDHGVDRVYSRETIEQLRRAASRDKPVLRVLDAYVAGAVTKDDVLTYTNMQERTYHNAHVRLKRLIRALTDHQLALKARA